MTPLESAAYDAFDDDGIEPVLVASERGMSASDVVDAILVDADEPEAIVPAPMIAEAIVVDALARDLAFDDDALEATVVEVAELTPAIEVKTGERHLKIAPDSVARRRRVRIAAAGAAVTISATLFAVVGFNVELAQHQIQLQHLQNQLTTEQTRYYDLRNQVAERSSPGRIVEAAKKLGLTQAQTSYVDVPIPPPPADPTGTSDLLGNVHDNAGGSLDPPQ